MRIPLSNINGPAIAFVAIVGSVIEVGEKTKNVARAIIGRPDPEIANLRARLRSIQAFARRLEEESLEDAGLVLLREPEDTPPEQRHYHKDGSYCLDGLCGRAHLMPGFRYGPNGLEPVEPCGPDCKPTTCGQPCEGDPE